MELESHFDDFTRRNWRRVEDGTVRFAMVGLGWWTRGGRRSGVGRRPPHDSPFSTVGSTADGSDRRLGASTERKIQK